jgi:hypothetical protein
MTRALPLLEQVRRLLERTYAMEPAIADLSPFVIGDQGLTALYGAEDRAIDTVESGLSAIGPRTLVRESRGEVRVSVYYPDAMIERLEAHPPQDGLDDANVDDFAALVEELDHLLLLGERVRRGREISLFELELHANVSKHLVLARFLAGRWGKLSGHRRTWLRHQLFEKHRFSDPRPAVRRRYEQAGRWAVRFLDRLTGTEMSRRLALLREFHWASSAAKLALVERL